MNSTLFYLKEKIIDHGLHNALAISLKLRTLYKNKGEPTKALASQTQLSQRIIQQVVSGTESDNITYYSASTVADYFKYDKNILYNDTLESSAILNNTELYNLYFSGFDIAMCIRLFKYLEANKLLPDIDVDIIGRQNNKEININNSRVIGSLSNGHIQNFYIECQDDILTVGGPLSCLEEKVLADEIIITLPKNTYDNIRDGVFALYQNLATDINLDHFPLVKGNSRYLLTLLKKHHNSNQALEFLIGKAVQIISLDKDYSAMAECFKFFAISQNCTIHNYGLAFNILRQVFSACIEVNNLKDAEYTLSAMAAIVQKNNCSKVEFIDLCMNIIDSNLNIENNNFNLLIFITIKNSFFLKNLNGDSLKKVNIINNHIKDFIDLQYHNVTFR